MKNTIMFISLVIILFGLFVVFGEPYLDNINKNKIGLLDVNKVLASIPQIKSMQADLKKKFDPRGKKVVDLQNNFRNEIINYRKNNTDLSGDVLKKEQQKLITENKKLQKTKLSFQRELIAAQNQALEPILKQINNIANEIGRKEGFDLIVAKTSALYNKPHMEITNRVIAQMNKIAK